MLQKINHSIEIIVGIYQHHGSEELPKAFHCEHLENFLEGTAAAGQRYNRIGINQHPVFTVTHVADNFHTTQLLVTVLNGIEEIRDDTVNMRPGSQRLVSHGAHQTYAPTPVYDIETGAAKDLPPEVEQRIAKLCKRIYRVLSMSGYGRMDLRLTEDGRVFVLEANPNPNLSYGEDLAESAAKVGISFEALLQRILNLGLRYQAEWKA